MTKIERAKEIVAANPNATRNELVDMFMKEMSMSKAGATTYYYNAIKDQPSQKKGKVEKKKVQKKATSPSPVKSVEIVRAKNLETIKKVAAKKSSTKYNQMQQHLVNKGVDVDTILESIKEDVDIRSISTHLPLFIRKELGL